jgi:hypothetical protein
METARTVAIEFIVGMRAMPEVLRIDSASCNHQCVADVARSPLIVFTPVGDKSLLAATSISLQSEKVPVERLFLHADRRLILGANHAAGLV